MSKIYKMNKNIVSNLLFVICSPILLSACQSNAPTVLISDKSSYPSQSRLDLSKDLPNHEKNMDLKPFLKKNHWINLFLSEIEPPNSAINFNFNSLGENIRLNLNCSDSNEQPFFLIEDLDGADVLSSSSEEAEQIEFILDQQVFPNPFQNTQSKDFENFKQIFYQAKLLTIRAYVLEDHSSQTNESTPVREYSFNNQYAEVLKAPSPHCSPST